MGTLLFATIPRISISKKWGVMELVQGNKQAMMACGPQLPLELAVKKFPLWVWPALRGSVAGKNFTNTMIRDQRMVIILPIAFSAGFFERTNTMNTFAFSSPRVMTMRFLIFLLLQVAAVSTFGQVGSNRVQATTQPVVRGAETPSPFPGPRTDSLLVSLFETGSNAVFADVVTQPGKYRLQVIYTRIDRNHKNKPSFTNYYFNYDPRSYFNPASMVKMPLAFLSLEKLHALRRKGINKYTTVVFDSTETWHRPLHEDTTAISGLPTMAHFIKRAFLISENDPYNRMYQWMGGSAINRGLHGKGYADARITRQFMGQTTVQNRATPPVRFLDPSGAPIYTQPARLNPDSFDFRQRILLGTAHLDRRDSLVRAPFDFTEHNNLSLSSMQRMLQAVLFPGSVSRRQRFRLPREDYAFLYRWLSQFPSETDDPKYDTSLFYDSYVKFFFRDSSRRLPPGVRVFNKVGWSYGFLTDVSYVADFERGVEFMLAATLYVNSDGVLNDGKYEYNTIGYPFLFELGQTIYRYEINRQRKYRPDLSDFRIDYGRRNSSDRRPALREVDN
jgi:hypothetical protein